MVSDGFFQKSTTIFPLIKIYFIVGWPTIRLSWTVNRFIEIIEEKGEIFLKNWWFFGWQGFWKSGDRLCLVGIMGHVTIPNHSINNLNRRLCSVDHWCHTALPKPLYPLSCPLNLIAALSCTGWSVKCRHRYHLRVRCHHVQATIEQLKQTTSLAHIAAINSSSRIM